MRVVFVLSKVWGRHARERLCVANKVPVRINTLKKISRHVESDFDSLFVFASGARQYRVGAAEEVRERALGP